MAPRCCGHSIRVPSLLSDLTAGQQRGPVDAVKSLTRRDPRSLRNTAVTQAPLDPGARRPPQGPEAPRPVTATWAAAQPCSAAAPRTPPAHPRRAPLPRRHAKVLALSANLRTP